MNWIFKISLLVMLMFVSILGQNGKSLYLKADFNQMIAVYGKNNISLHLPKKITLDSLHSTPFHWVDGYRLQVFAGNNKENAMEMIDKVKQAVPDSVYLIKDDSIYRVQFGDYTNRIVAETKVDSMRKYGWPEAWIVTRRVKQYIYGDSERTRFLPDIKNPQLYDQSEDYFTVQIAACANSESAKKMVLKIKDDFPDTDILKIGGLYKVVIGRFSQRTEADGVLERVRNTGYKDAWVTGRP